MNPEGETNPNEPTKHPEPFPPLSLTMEEELEAFESLSPWEQEDLDVPKPMECLQENPVPPFLTKTYELVEDRSLDRIISWGKKGESFVVWDPVEFSRIILPRNFKHNNLSSFVRQLNTYGFHKIDTDKWEFANESFRRGERHLLKNIQRRKYPQSQKSGVSAGASSETVKSGVEGEVERLREERSMMMQELVELQQQQRGSVQHMGEVDQRLQSAEQRQKQMLSFLAKLFRNPEFLARLRQQKDQELIGSSRMKRRFLRHQQLEGGQSASSVGGHIVKYSSDQGEPNLSSAVPEVLPLPIEPPPDSPLQDTGLGIKGMLFQMEDIELDELAVTNEMSRAQGLIGTPELFGEGTSILEGEAPDLKGKSVMGPQPDMGTDAEYLVSFPEDLSVEKDFLEFPSPAIQSMVREEDMWNLGLEASAVMSSSTSELWDIITSYDVPELGSTGGFLDILDTSSIQAAGGSGSDKWSADQNPIGKLDSQAGHSRDDSPKHTDS